MDIKFRTALVLLAAIPEAAAAQPTLQYNFEYVCNGERVVVGHCRADSDIPGAVPTRPESDYCAVYYPDRPQKPNSSLIPDTVLRSRVISMLDACGAFGSTGTGAASHKNAVPASAAPVPAAIPPAQAQADPASKGQAQKQFCEQILQLKTQAPQGFSSIDRGPMKGGDADVHVSSLQLLHGDCMIDRGPKPAIFSCSWVLPAAQADAFFRQTGQGVADCLHLPSDMTTYGDGTSMQDLEPDHVLYHLQTYPDDSGKETEIELSVSVLHP
jgi:hypothetical protein